MPKHKSSQPGKNIKIGTKPALSVPLRLNGKAIGVLSVERKAFVDVFGKADLKLLKSAADTASFAMKNIYLEEEIKALDNVSTDFVSSFPHELRTPLTVIMDALEMLLDGSLGVVNDRQKHCLELTKKNANRLWRLTEELLELSKHAAAGRQSRRKLVNLNRLIAKTTDGQESLANERSVLINILLPDKETKIWGDEEKLDLAFGNILNNAIVYNRQKGEVGVKLEDLRSSVRISVSDKGAGIPKRDRKKIFDKSYRVEMRAKNALRQWGLGLVTAGEIVHLHGGEISCDAKPGKGSIFTIVLPKDFREA